MNKNQNTIILEKDIIALIKEKNTEISDIALKWELFNYINRNSLIKVGTKKYQECGNVYSYDYKSDITKDIDSFLSKKYPDIKMVIWETRQLNEWLNLLLAVNVIYIEVEKDFVDYVFSTVNDIYGKSQIVLLNPDESTLSKYLREDLIVIKTLYSKSPLSKKDRKIKLEKLAVDTFCDAHSLGSRGITDVLHGIRDNYAINVDKMLSYAARRRVKKEILEIWEDHNDW